MGEEQDWAFGELQRRKEMLQALKELGGPVGIKSAITTELRIYRGQAGIYFDSEQTKSASCPQGVTVTVMHNGSSYEDDYSDDGLVYHFPSTKRHPSSDANEIESARQAHRLALPIFVVLTNSKNQSLRDVRVAYIEAVDEGNKTLLITFVEEPIDVIEGELEDSAEFDPFGAMPARVMREVAMRPNQQRFKANLARVYGHVCAVCDLATAALIDAAHLVPKGAGGSDDARNGLPLCANHHRAFDRFLWRIDPETWAITYAPGVDRTALRITRDDLMHLATRPHKESVRAFYETKDALAFIARD